MIGPRAPWRASPARWQRIPPVRFARPASPRSLIVRPPKPGRLHEVKDDGFRILPEPKRAQDVDPPDLNSPPITRNTTCSTERQPYQEPDRRLLSFCRAGCKGRMACHFRASNAFANIALPCADFSNTSFAMRLSLSNKGKSNQARVWIKSRLRAASDRPWLRRSGNQHRLS